MISRLLVALLFTAALLEQSPHLVHHLFEHDDVQSDCPFVTASQRHDATPAPDAPILANVQRVGPLVTSLEPSASSHQPRRAAARAPPAIA